MFLPRAVALCEIKHGSTPELVFTALLTQLVTSSDTALGEDHTYHHYNSVIAAMGKGFSFTTEAHTPEFGGGPRAILSPPITYLPEQDFVSRPTISASVASGPPAVGDNRATRAEPGPVGKKR